MIDLSGAGKQRSERYRPLDPPKDPINAFGHVLASFGLDPDAIVPSGKLERFDVDKRGDQVGWYILFQGEVWAGSFGNWKTGLKERWCSKEAHQMTDAESARYKAMVAEASRQRKAQEAFDHAKGKVKANTIWDRLKPASQNHPYPAKKGVHVYGLKQSRNKIVVPVTDESGTIWNLQFISPDGKKKRFLKLARKKGLCFTIPGDERLYICEGYSTGATIHEATGGTVVIAFDAGNLPTVARVVREKQPRAQITICADNDRFTAGNPGLTKGKEAADGISAKLALPCFDGLPGADDKDLKYSDFNDLFAVSGNLEIVRAQLKASARSKYQPQSFEAMRFKGRVISRPKKLESIFRYDDQLLIPKGVVGVITATGGTGKTFFIISLATAGATGKNFGPINAPRPIKTLIIVGEDTQDELDRRAWDTCSGQFPDNLAGISVYGEVGPFMRLEGSTPVFADGYYWLEETISGCPGLALLFIDPKSRFYGLDENNPDHATQWVQGLEILAKRYGITILFTHHTSKENGAKISQNMSRGSSALVDACRWQAGMVRMDEEIAKKYGIENPRNYVLFDVPKSNYGVDLPGHIIFRRGENGVLVWDDPEESHIKSMAEELLNILHRYPDRYTRRELDREKCGAEIARDMVDRFKGFKRGRDMNLVINHLLKSGLLTEESTMSGKTTRCELIPR